LGHRRCVLGQAVTPPGQAQLDHDRIAPIARGIGQALFQREIADPQRAGCRGITCRQPFQRRQAIDRSCIQNVSHRFQR
jgi:hypothetical protein